MPQSRVYGGEVIIPAGRTIIVAAPLSGILRARAGRHARARPVGRTRASRRVRAVAAADARGPGQPGALEDRGRQAGQTHADAAARPRRSPWTGPSASSQSEAGSQRAVDEAQAQYDLAQKALEAATARRDLLDKVVGEVESGTAGADPDRVAGRTACCGTCRPCPGRPSRPGRRCSRWWTCSRVWVRVPVYVGDLPEIDAAGRAPVGRL